MKVLDYVDLQISRINRGAQVIAAAWLFFLAIVILVDVVARFFFNAPIAGTLEIVANSIVAIVFLQISYSIRSGGLLRAEVFDEKLPRWLVGRIQAMGSTLGACLFLAIAYSAWGPLLNSWSIMEFAGNEASLKVPVYPVRTLLFVMSLLVAINFLFLAREQWSLADRKPAQERG
jgi:TRAP-type C4-dicarboxylate transport system permease small subunit